MTFTSDYLRFLKIWTNFIDLKITILFSDFFRLMDLYSTNKAIEDLNIFAEDLFNAGKLGLDDYLKVRFLNIVDNIYIFIFEISFCPFVMLYLTDISLSITFCVQNSSL